MHIYTVSAGDTLFSVADKFSVTVDSLTLANNLSANSPVFLGQRLRIPVRSVSVVLRHGQTAVSVAKALQVSPQHIVKENPAIGSLSPGDILTVTFPACAQ